VSTKHDRTLAAIFARPTRANIRWDDVRALFAHLDAAIDERAGSRVLVTLNGEGATFHRPHPGKELSKPAVKSVRELLEIAGVGP
jgi:hypothetical protein